jgi:F420-non-reducing hydrogenase small subunit
VDDRDPLASLLEEAEVLYCPLLMDRGELPEVDLVLAEGIVRGREDEEKLREARAKARTLVAWGTCSAFLGVPALANGFALEDLIAASFEGTRDAFSYYFAGTGSLSREAYQEGGSSLLRRAASIDDFVRVDYLVPGCPPPVRVLIELIRELKGNPPAKGSAKVVCGDCGRKAKPGSAASLEVFPSKPADPALCLVSGGTACAGAVTRGGCGAPCPAGGLPCWGCRGPTDAVLRQLREGETLEEVLLGTLSRRTKLPVDALRPALKVLRTQGCSILSVPQVRTVDAAKIR